MAGGKQRARNEGSVFKKLRKFYYFNLPHNIQFYEMKQTTQHGGCESGKRYNQWRGSINRIIPNSSCNNSCLCCSLRVDTFHILPCVDIQVWILWKLWDRMYNPCSSWCHPSFGLFGMPLVNTYSCKIHLFKGIFWLINFYIIILYFIKIFTLDYVVVAPLHTSQIKIWEVFFFHARWNVIPSEGTSIILSKQRKLLI